MKIEHDAEAQRFVAPLDAGEAYLAYTEAADGTLDLQHTIVPPAEQGSGVGSSLVEHAFRYAREHDRKIIPSCAFVQSWLEEHPEQRDLIARG